MLAHMTALKLREVAENWSAKESPSLVLGYIFTLSFRCVPVLFELNGLAFPFVNFACNSCKLLESKLNETELSQKYLSMSDIGGKMTTLYVSECSRCDEMTYS